MSLVLLEHTAPKGRWKTSIPAIPTQNVRSLVHLVSMDQLRMPHGGSFLPAAKPAGHARKVFFFWMFRLCPVMNLASVLRVSNNTEMSFGPTGSKFCPACKTNSLKLYLLHLDSSAKNPRVEISKAQSRVRDVRIRNSLFLFSQRTTSRWMISYTLHIYFPCKFPKFLRSLVKLQGYPILGVGPSSSGSVMSSTEHPWSSISLSPQHPTGEPSVS